MNRQEILLVICTSVGLICAFPPFHTGLVAVLALVPFFILLHSKTPKEAFRIGYVMGLLWMAGLVYWVGWATIPGLLGALVYLPLFYAFFALLQSWLIKRWGSAALWAAPLLWTSLEYLESLGPLGLPWNALAYTQTYTPRLIQFASITGTYGITFWVVLLNVLFYFLFRSINRLKRVILYASCILLLFIIPWIHGTRSISKQTERQDTIKVALLQGNIDPYKKWTPGFIDSNFTTYERMTRKAAQSNPDLIIWPETATPCYLRYRYKYLNRVKFLADSLNTPILTGTPDYERNPAGGVKSYNSAFLIHPNSWNIQRYHKSHLVPFSEKVPLSDVFPFILKWTRSLNLETGDFAKGDSLIIFKMQLHHLKKPVRFGAAICYDSVFPYYNQRLVQKGAQFIVILTNDGWFGHTSGPYQHAQMAVLRAIENRVWIARCANTGISCIIDPYGYFQNKTTYNKEDILIGTIGLQETTSWFVRSGKIFPILMFLFSGLIIFGTILHWAWIRWIKKS